MEPTPTRWKADFEQDGYLVVEDVLDAQTLAMLRAGIDGITADPDALPDHLRRHIQFERDYVERRPDQNNHDAVQVGNAVRNIMELPLFDPLFGELIAHEPLLDVLEVLFGSGEFHFHNLKCIVKAPHISSMFLWHRDLPYLRHSTPNLITALLCLDDMTEANGATVVLPGTHRLAHEDVRDADIDMPEDELPADAPRVLVECRGGSAVLFHVNIIHGGGANRSDLTRRNLVAIWAGQDAHPVTPSRYAYQGLMPRSADPSRRRQMQMTFPRITRSTADQLPE